MIVPSCGSQIETVDVSHLHTSHSLEPERPQVYFQELKAAVQSLSYLCP